MDIQTPDKLAEFSKINKTVSNAMDCHASKDRKQELYKSEATFIFTVIKIE